jgi:hypothetical protein
LGQEQEGRLEDVFRVVGAAQNAPTGGEDHKPVAADQGLEGARILSVRESLEEFLIGGTGVEVCDGQPLNGPSVDAGIRSCHCHRPAG